jgi:hypothetical protein
MKAGRAVGVIELDAERHGARRVEAQRVERAEGEVAERVLRERLRTLNQVFLVPMVKRWFFTGIVRLSEISKTS